MIQKQLFSNRCFLQKFTWKHLCWSLFLTMLQVSMPETSLKEELWHRYLPVNFLQFFKKPYLKKITGWLLLLIPLLQPKFYPLITLCWFFSSLFSFIFDNCNYGSLLKKCPKMKTFLLFTIIYSKININVVKIIRLGNNLPTHIREYTDFLWQKPQQLPSAKANFKGWKYVFRKSRRCCEKVTRSKIVSKGFNLTKKWFHSTEISNQCSIFIFFAHQIFLLW